MEIKYGMFNDIDVSFPELPQRHQIAFCAALCERTIPNFKDYDYFYGTNHFECLRNTLDEIWISLLNNQFEPERLESLVDNCFDVDEYGEDLSSVPLAENALVCLNNTLFLFRCPSKTSVKEAIHLVHDSFYFYFETRIAGIINGDLSDEQIKERYNIVTANDILPFREISERYALADPDYDPYDEKYK
jgi:uncharacterized protein YjaG (DUF416 family)